MQTYIPVFLLLLVSIICFAATASGWAYSRRAGYIIAASFLVFALLLGITLFLEADLLTLFLIAVPIGGFLTLMGFSMIASGFLYRQKTEGIYMDFVHVHRTKGREYYGLVFKYQANRRTVQTISDDSYLLSDIKKHYETHSTYTIWINPKKPQEFRVKRFFSLYPGIAAAIFGIVSLWMPFQVLSRTL